MLTVKTISKFRANLFLFVCLTHSPLKSLLPLVTSPTRFKGQGKLCQLTCTGRRDHSNHTIMTVIRSSRPQKKTKKYVTLTRKFPWKSCSTSHLPFLSSNLKILKALLKTFPTEMKPTKCPAKEKLTRQQMRKKKAGEKAKEKNKDYCVTFDFFKPSLRTQTYSGRGFFPPVACHWAERSDDRKYVCVRRLSQSDSKPRHLKKKNHCSYRRLGKAVHHKL